MPKRLALAIGTLAAGAGLLAATTLGTAAAAAPSAALASSKLPTCSYDVYVNQRRSLFRGNAALRKALNFAVDRTAFAGAAKPLTHLLAPGMAGSASTRPYPVRPNLARARQLASGHLRGGAVEVAYQSQGSNASANAQLLKDALVGLGFDEGRIEMVAFAGFDLQTAAFTKGAPYDLVLGLGTCPHSRDSASVLKSFVDPKGRLGQYATDSSLYRRKLASISRRLRGRARLVALGKLDVEIMRNLAPAVPLYASGN
jgi:ABC-type oligopeptide transport system substrate-binding subunit